MWSWSRCSIDSWLIDCLRLRVLYAGDVCGITLGDAVWVFCGGTVITLEDGVVGCLGR